MAVFHKNYKKNGSGFFDAFSSVKNFVIDNKDTIVGGIGGLKDTVSGIKDTYDAVKEIRGMDDKILSVAEEVKTDEILNDIKLLQELRKLREDKVKQGKGFNYI